MESQIFVKMLISVVLLGLLGLVMRLYKALVREPERLRAMLRKQGITGPPPSFLLGNLSEIKKAQSATANSTATAAISHNTATALFPFFEHWRNQYGNLFMFSLGNTQIVYVNQPDVVKEMTTCISLDLGKPSYQQKDRGSLLGQGILTSNGAVWAHQRKILAPELAMDKVKGMMSLVSECSVTLINSWKHRIESGSSTGVADIKIDADLRSFSGDVISRACFGSNYSQGEKIFTKLRALQEVESKKVFATGVPGLRYLPTSSNREAWALEKEVWGLVLEVVKGRKEVGYEKDLLQKILEGAKSSTDHDLSQEETDRFIVDNCKNIYLAGYETTAVAAVWCLMLLASNQNWQSRVRAEVLQVCDGQIPDGNMLRKMKQLAMVISESLRLYPPVPVVSREALKDMKFGELQVPKGVNLWSMVLTTHTDPEIWGPDSYQFNPKRFENGITGACKLPHMYMPFGVGPRVCLGQNLAILELKILLSLILSNFSFTLSPSYVHSPAVRLVIEPEHGVSLLIKKL